MWVNTERAANLLLENASFRSKACFRIFLRKFNWAGMAAAAALRGFWVVKFANLRLTVPMV